MAAILASLEQLPFVKEISPDDWMAKGKTPDWYFNRGYEALKLIHDICWRNKLVPSSVLDFGCGHGNVARMLKAAYP
jgi:SAM-dependent methyltransferase